MDDTTKENLEFSRGLQDIVASVTQIGYIDGQAGKLEYRGYDINELAEHSTYEETVFLLLYGKLPDQAELSSFNEKLISYRHVIEEVINKLTQLPCTCHPMSMLRTGISHMECIDEFCLTPADIQSKQEAGIKLIAQMPVLTAAISRILNNKEPIYPDPGLSHAANFLYMLKGERADPLEEKVMDVSLIIQADHGMNASTFASLVVAATLSDIHSAITAGIAALKGPLHGGANEEVLKMLLNFHSVEEAEYYVEDLVARNLRIVGFGHRVYKTYDPRAIILEQYAKDISRITNNQGLYEIAHTIEKKVWKDWVIKVFSQM
ncbi:MAG: citrate/2-methylcitrate synthase [Methanosarcinales archaeon]|nr:citrate/2-methylcitrate synthase [Methanosarcinales archaeon]